MDERALPMMIGGSMTAEIIAIVMVGVALAGVILASARWPSKSICRSFGFSSTSRRRGSRTARAARFI